MLNQLKRTIPLGLMLGIIGAVAFPAIVTGFEDGSNTKRAALLGFASGGFFAGFVIGRGGGDEK
jgi:drug/metabolite transporter (DMT)-like permease